MSEEKEKALSFKDLPLGDMSNVDPEDFLLKLSDEDREAFYKKLDERIGKYRVEYTQREAAEAEGKKPKTTRAKKTKPTGNIDLTKPLGEL